MQQCWALPSRMQHPASQNLVSGDACKAWSIEHDLIPRKVNVQNFFSSLLFSLGVVQQPLQRSAQHVQNCFDVKFRKAQSFSNVNPYQPPALISTTTQVQPSPPAVQSKLVDPISDAAVWRVVWCHCFIACRIHHLSSPIHQHGSCVLSQITAVRL